MDNETNFSEFLMRQIKDRGIQVRKLSEISGISLKNLEALVRGDFSLMPPAPYFRGYVIRLSAILDFDPDFWWLKIKDSGLVKNSGEKDAPPTNRFIKSQFLKFAWIALISLILLAYIFLQLPRILGKPALEITYPDKNPSVSTSSTATIRGTISDWNQLTINGEVISVNPDGAWEKTVLLEHGLNTLEIEAKKFLGGEVKITEQIIYQP